MKEVPEGSAVRVTGVCMLADSNPFNGDVPFSVLMRSVDDIAVIARPPFLNVKTLTEIASFLLLIVAASSTWVWLLRRKVRRQTAELATRIEAEAILERKRSRILEDINGTRSFDSREICGCSHPVPSPPTRPSPNPQKLGFLIDPTNPLHVGR